MSTLHGINRMNVVLRMATEADHQALSRLAELDTTSVPAGPVLVAEIDGAIPAAYAIREGRPIADPFQRTAELVELLRTRSQQLVATNGRYAQLSGWLGLSPRQRSSVSA